MPTYEYQCLKCHKKFEKFQRMTEPPVKKCPRCGGKVERLIGAGSGLIFKGSGFYQTDYKKASPKKGEEKPAVKESKPEAKSPKGTDPRPNS